MKRALPTLLVAASASLAIPAAANAAPTTTTTAVPVNVADAIAALKTAEAILSTVLGQYVPTSATWPASVGLPVSG